MTAYFIGDIPAVDLVIDPARGGMEINLIPFNVATVDLRAPNGQLIASSGFLATIVSGTVVVKWPTVTVLDTPGVYQIGILLEGPNNVRERLSPTRIVVEAENSGWYTLDLARDDWDGAPDEDLLLYDLLEEAKRECLAYGPAADVVAGRPPYAWRKAQIMHARTLLNADAGDTEGVAGFGTFTVTPKSLEKNTRNVLRPKTAVPVIG